MPGFIHQAAMSPKASRPPNSPETGTNSLQASQVGRITSPPSGSATGNLSQCKRSRLAACPQLMWPHVSSELVELVRAKRNVVPVVKEIVGIQVVVAEKFDQRTCIELAIFY